MKIKTLILILSCFPLLFSCIGKSETEHQSLEEISKQELATALTERDELLALVKEVAIGMQQIKQLEGMITPSSADGNERQKEKILKSISDLKECIQKRKQQLEALEEKLSNSTINSKELQETIHAINFQIDAQIEEIESLKNQLTAANARIGSLNNTVDSLNATVSAVEEERDAAQNASARMENELNTGYYIIASKSELKKFHVIESGSSARRK